MARLCGRFEEKGPFAGRQVEKASGKRDPAARTAKSFFWANAQRQEAAAVQKNRRVMKGGRTAEWDPVCKSGALEEKEFENRRVVEGEK